MKKYAVQCTNSNSKKRAGTTQHKPTLPTYIYLFTKTDYDIFHSYQLTATAHTIKAKRTIIQIKLCIVEIGHNEEIRTADDDRRMYSFALLYTYYNCYYYGICERMMETNQFPFIYTVRKQFA